jgi:ribosomal protein L21E
VKIRKINKRYLTYIRFLGKSMAVTKKKDSSLLVKINAEDKKKFIELCEEQDTSASREVRHFIRRYLKEAESRA